MRRTEVTMAESRGGTRSLAEQAYTRLRNQILTCEIVPGALVTEGQLAAEFKLGKTPIREALGRLAGEGFVRPVVRKGYEVTPVTIGGVLEIFEAYSVFAPEVIALIAVRATPAEKQEVAERARRWASGTEEVHPEEMPHAEFVGFCRNPVIIEMTRGVIGHISRIFNFTLIHGGFSNAEFLEAREETIEALRVGDAARAREGMQRVIEGERITILATLQSSPSLLSTPLSLRPGTGAAA